MSDELMQELDAVMRGVKPQATATGEKPSGEVDWNKELADIPSGVPSASAPAPAQQDSLFSPEEEQYISGKINRPGYLSAFSGGVQRNWGQIKSIAPTLKGVYAEATGDEAGAAAAFQQSQAIQAEAPKQIVPNFSYIHDWDDFSTWLSERLGEQSLTMLSMAATGGAGGLTANLAGRGLMMSTASRAALTKAGAVAGAYAGGTALETSGTADELREATGSYHPAMAVGAGAVKGALEIYTPAMLIRGLAQPGKRLVTEIAKNAVREGLTEGAQESIDAAARSYLDPNYNFFSGQNAVRITEATLTGFAVGGVYGGGVEAAAHKWGQTKAPRPGEEREISPEEIAKFQRMDQAEKSAPPPDLKMTGPLGWLRDKFLRRSEKSDDQLFEGTTSDPRDPLDIALTVADLKRAAYFKRIAEDHAAKIDDLIDDATPRYTLVRENGTSDGRLYTATDLETAQALVPQGEKLQAVKINMQKLAPGHITAEVRDLPLDENSRRIYMLPGTSPEEEQQLRAKYGTLIGRIQEAQAEYLLPGGFTKAEELKGPYNELLKGGLRVIPEQRQSFHYSGPLHGERVDITKVKSQRGLQRIDHMQIEGGKLKAGALMATHDVGANIPREAPMAIDWGKVDPSIVVPVPTHKEMQLLSKDDIVFPAGMSADEAFAALKDVLVVHPNLHNRGRATLQLANKGIKINAEGRDFAVAILTKSVPVRDIVFSPNRDIGAPVNLETLRKNSHGFAEQVTVARIPGADTKELEATAKKVRSLMPYVNSVTDQLGMPRTTVVISPINDIFDGPALETMSNVIYIPVEGKWRSWFKGGKVTTTDLLNILLHEVGHAFTLHNWAKLPYALQEQVNRGYERARLAQRITGYNSNSGGSFTTFDAHNTNAIYWASKVEYFAEQFRRWSSERLQERFHEDRFFKRVGGGLTRLSEEYKQKVWPELQKNFSQADIGFHSWMDYFEGLRSVDPDNVKGLFGVRAKMNVREVVMPKHGGAKSPELKATIKLAKKTLEKFRHLLPEGWAGEIVTPNKQSSNDEGIAGQAMRDSQVIRIIAGNLASLDPLQIPLTYIHETVHAIYPQLTAEEKAMLLAEAKKQNVNVNEEWYYNYYMDSIKEHFNDDPRSDPAYWEEVVQSWIDEEYITHFFELYATNKFRDSKAKSFFDAMQQLMQEVTEYVNGQFKSVDDLMRAFYRGEIAARSLPQRTGIDMSSAKFMPMARINYWRHPAGQTPAGRDISSKWWFHGSESAKGQDLKGKPFGKNSNTEVIWLTTHTIFADIFAGLSPYNTFTPAELGAVYKLAVRTKNPLVVDTKGSNPFGAGTQFFMAEIQQRLDAAMAQLNARFNGVFSDVKTFKEVEQLFTDESFWAGMDLAEQVNNGELTPLRAKQLKAFWSLKNTLDGKALRNVVWTAYSNELTLTSKIFDFAKANGYDSVLLKNLQDNLGVQDQLVVFDPEQLRTPNAEFSPWGSGLIGMFDPKVVWQREHTLVEMQKEGEVDSARATKALAGERIGSTVSPYDSIMSETFNRERAEAAKVLDIPIEQAAPSQIETMTIHGIFGQTFRGENNPKVDRYLSGASGKIGVQADRISWFSKLFFGLHQLAWLNPNLSQLRNYVSLTEQWNASRMRWIAKADATARKWDKLAARQRDALADVLFWATEMKYRTPAEVRADIVRMPTQQELATAFRSRRMTRDAVQLYGEIGQQFNDFLTEVERVSRVNIARTIRDPAAQQRALLELADDMAQMRKKPYFPMTRFGEWTITVRDPGQKDAVVWFSAYDTVAERDAAVKFVALKHPLHRIQVGRAIEDIHEFMGLPAPLLKQIKNNLPGISQIQQDWIDRLMHLNAPEQSFRKRWLKRSGTPGYSLDAFRAFANYFVKGGNYLARVEYNPLLNAEITSLRATLPTIRDTYRRGQMIEYMQQHYRYIMEGGQDWSKTKALFALWQLGYSPVAAGMNLLQNVQVSWPYFTSTFGNVKATASMMRAMADLKKTFTFSTQGQNQAFIAAKEELVSQGKIDVGQAPELGNFVEGGRLSRLMAGDEIQRALRSFMYYGMIGFQYTEKFNRNLTFRVAWDLATSTPNHPLLRRIGVTHLNEIFDIASRRGLTHEQAAAVIFAREAIDRTQFVYSPYSRPTFLRSGPMSAFMVFFGYTQSMLYAMRHNPGAAKMWLITLGLFGISGLPGADDLNEMLKLVSRRIFGTNFNLQKEIRKYVHGLTQDTVFDKTGPDLAMHGISRYSFGLGLMADGWGVPRFDASVNGSMAKIVPGLADLARNLSTVSSQTGWKDVTADLAKNAAGAGFGQMFALLKFLQAQPGGDEWKQWEGIMPRAMKAWSKAYRYASTGQETTSTGAKFVGFNVRDPDDVATIIAQALGLNPTKVSAKWESLLTTADEVKFYQSRRLSLLAQMDDAIRSKDQKTISDVVKAIAAYNREMASINLAGMGLDGNTLRQSLMMRARNRVNVELDIPQMKKTLPFVQEQRRLWPGVAAEKVK